MALLPGGWTAAILAAAPPEDAAAQARRILAEGGYQADLPHGPTPPAAAPLHLPAGVELLLRLLLWTALAVAVALAVAWLVRRLRGGARDEAAAPEPAPPPLVVATEGPERLAAEGRFAEAIHALLLATLAALSRAARLPASLTSREILARTALPPAAREALAGLVEAVERSRFGGAVADEADYRACQARFGAFLAATGGRAPRGAA